MEAKSSEASPHVEGKDNYILQRHFAATARLNYQHYLWQSTFRFHLHPALPSCPPDARIADVGTGSGIWLLELSQQVPPTTRLEGLDINLAQSPPTGWLPSNVSFHEFDYYSEVPASLVGAYDVVHVRLIAITIRDNDPTPVIENFRKMLKPGGYLQWEEHEPAYYVSKVKPENKADVIEELGKILTKPIMSSDGKTQFSPTRDWVLSVPGLLSNAGFQDARVLRYVEEPYMAGFWTEMHLTTMVEFADLILQKKDPKLNTAMNELLDKASAATRSGAAVGYDKLVFLARKAK